MHILITSVNLKILTSPKNLRNHILDPTHHNMDLIQLNLNGGIATFKGRIQSGWLFSWMPQTGKGSGSKNCVEKGSFHFSLSAVETYTYYFGLSKKISEILGNIYYLVKIIPKRIILKTVPIKWYSNLFSISKLFSSKCQACTSI